MAEECTVTVACRALGVSVSGYYAWRERVPSAREQDDAVLLPHIRRVYQDSRGLYGRPPVHAALKQQGLVCSSKRVSPLLRDAALHSSRLVALRGLITEQRPETP